MSAPQRRAVRLAALLLFATVGTTGCAAIPIALGLDAASTGVSAFQSYKARQVQRELVDEVKALREEIQRWRESGTRDPDCACMKLGPSLQGGGGFFMQPAPSIPPPHDDGIAPPPRLCMSDPPVECPR